MTSDHAPPTSSSIHLRTVWMVSSLFFSLLLLLSLVLSTWNARRYGLSVSPQRILVLQGLFAPFGARVWSPPEHRNLSPRRLDTLSRSLSAFALPHEKPCFVAGARFLSNPRQEGGEKTTRGLSPRPLWLDGIASIAALQRAITRRIWPILQKLDRCRGARAQDLERALVLLERVRSWPVLTATQRVQVTSWHRATWLRVRERRERKLRCRWKQELQQLKQWESVKGLRPQELWRLKKQKAKREAWLRVP